MVIWLMTEEHFNDTIFCSGDPSDAHEFKEFLFNNYPKLRDGGGFELLRITGSTRSRQLSVIPCPNEGYTVNYLRDPRTLVGHATVYIRPLQRDLSDTSVSNLLKIPKKH